MLSRYNRVANERLFAKCVQLHDVEYRKRRAGSFGSFHGLLNHILLGDRRWLGLFESGERATSPLNQILYDDFSDLRSGRTREDARIEAFFARLDATFWSRSFAYTNNQGKDYWETAHVACTHLFKSPNASSRASPRDAESDLGGASSTRPSPYRHSLKERQYGQP